MSDVPAVDAEVWAELKRRMPECGCGARFEPATLPTGPVRALICPACSLVHIPDQDWAVETAAEAEAYVMRKRMFTVAKRQAHQAASTIPAGTWEHYGPFYLATLDCLDAAEGKFNGDGWLADYNRERVKHPDRDFG